MKYRRLVNIILWPMNFIGVNPMQDDSVQNYVRIIGCCLLHVYGMYGTFSFSYHSNNDFYNCVVPIAYGTCLVMVFGAVLFLQKYKYSVRQLLNSINNYVFTYPDEELLLVEYVDWLSESAYANMYFWALFYEIFGFMLATASPFIGYLFIGKLRTFIYPAYTPWKVDSALVYVLTYFFQSWVATSVFWVYYVLQIYFIFVLTEFLRQFGRLNRAICTLHERTCCDVFTQMTGEKRLGAQQYSQSNQMHLINRRANGLFEMRYNREYKTKLIACVKHHRKLLQLFKLFKEFYELFFSTELTTVAVSFSLLLYCLVEESDPERYSSLVGVTWLLVSNLFCRCFIGEQFADMNFRISDALYNETNWYELSLDNRKLLSIFHLMTTRSLTLKGFGFCLASFYTFSAIVRTSYSYFNLIRASL